MIKKDDFEITNIVQNYLVDRIYKVISSNTERSEYLASTSSGLVIMQILHSYLNYT